MLAAGTSDRDHKLVFSFLDIIGDQEADHIRELFPELRSLREGEDILRYRAVVSCQRFKPVNVKRIGQEADIKDQVRIPGDPVFEPEGHDRDNEGIVVFTSDKDAVQFLSEFSHQKVGSIKDIIRLGLDMPQDLPFLPDPVFHAALRLAGMSPARLLVPLDQRLVVRVHKEDLVGISLLSQCGQHLFHINERPVRPDIQTEDYLVHVAAGHKDQLHELVDQPHGEIVDTIEPFILQNIDGSCLSASAHSGHNNKTHFPLLTEKAVSGHTLIRV